MPSILSPAVGDTAPASAELGLIHSLEIVQNVTADPTTAASTSPTLWVNAAGLPELSWYILQDTGLVGCTFTPLISLDITGVANGGEWLALTAPQVIPFGAPAIPLHFVQRVPGVAAMGLRIVTPAGAANSTFRIILGAGA
jgi:hypothetical protein